MRKLVLISLELFVLKIRAKIRNAGNVLCFLEILYQHQNLP